MQPTAPQPISEAQLAAPEYSAAQPQCVGAADNAHHPGASCVPISQMGAPPAAAQGGAVMPQILSATAPPAVPPPQQYYPPPPQQMPVPPPQQYYPPPPVTLQQSPAAAALTAAGVPPAAAACAALASGGGQQAAEKPKQVKMTALLGSISAQLRGQAPALGEAIDAMQTRYSAGTITFTQSMQQLLTLVGKPIVMAAVCALGGTPSSSASQPAAAAAAPPPLPPGAGRAAGTYRPQLPGGVRRVGAAEPSPPSYRGHSAGGGKRPQMGADDSRWLHAAEAARGALPQTARERQVAEIMAHHEANKRARLAAGDGQGRGRGRGAAVLNARQAAAARGGGRGAGGRGRSAPSAPPSDGWAERGWAADGWEVAPEAEGSDDEGSQADGSQADGSQSGGDESSDDDGADGAAEASYRSLGADAAQTLAQKAAAAGVWVAATHTASGGDVPTPRYIHGLSFEQPISCAPSLLPPSAAPTANGAGKEAAPAAAPAAAPEEGAPAPAAAEEAVAASNGRGNGHTAPKVRLRWMAVGGVTPHPGVRNSLQLALFKL